MPAGTVREAFHSAIVAGSGNRLLMAIHQQVNQEIKIFRSKTFQVPQNIRNAVDPHTRILRTIQSQDADGAESAMRAHPQVRTKEKEFLEQMDRIIPWGEWIALIQLCYYEGERGNKPYR